MPKLINNLWFDKEAEEAATFYVSVFPNSKITEVQRYNAMMSRVSGQREGSVMLVSFELGEQKFLALNGGKQPWAQTSGFISFIIPCKNQAEIDHYWNAFADGGNEMPCGWIQDKFGLVWQVVPENIDSLMADPVKGKSAAQAMLKMKKIVIADMENASA